MEKGCPGVQISDFYPNLRFYPGGDPVEKSDKNVGTLRVWCSKLGFYPNLRFYPNARFYPGRNEVGKDCPGVQISDFIQISEFIQVGTQWKIQGTLRGR